MRRLPAYLYLLSPLDNLTLNSLPTMMLLAGAMHTAHLTHNDAAGVLHVMLALCAHNKAAPTVGAVVGSPDLGSWGKALGWFNGRPTILIVIIGSGQRCVPMK